MSKKIFTGLGILLILYWFGISLFIGFGQMFSYIWLAGGIFLIIFGRMKKSVLKKILAGLMIVSLCACAVLEIPIIKGAVSEPDIRLCHSPRSQGKRHQALKSFKTEAQCGNRIYRK